MKVKIQKLGDSLAVRIPKSLADKLSLSEGSQVDLSIEGNMLVIRAGKKRYDLHELVSQITEQNRQKEVDFGKPVGNDL